VTARPHLDAASDADLLGAVGGGDVAALRCLYDRHAPWLSTRLRHRCGDAGIVADVVEDTFLAVWRGAGRWRGDGEVAAWIWGIGVRQLVNHLRRAGRAARPAPTADPTIDVSAEERALDAMIDADVAGALARLSPELLVVVQAMVLDGLTAKETSSLLGLPIGTVKGRVRRAKALLRAELGPTELPLGALR
jgi:RNA polymerase sigma-70 factor (ECF subfamily)